MVGTDSLPLHYAYADTAHSRQSAGPFTFPVYRARSLGSGELRRTYILSPRFGVWLLRPCELWRRMHAGGKGAVGDRLRVVVVWVSTPAPLPPVYPISHWCIQSVIYSGRAIRIHEDTPTRSPRDAVHYTQKHGWASGSPGWISVFVEAGSNRGVSWMSHICPGLILS